MDNYYIETKSMDISFCMSPCNTLKCSRNKDGKLYKAMLKTPMRNWCSCCDFYLMCSSYTPKEKNVNE